MKHRTLDELISVAEVTRAGTRMPRRERLERLAELLENHPGRLRLFAGLEYVRPKDRALFRRKDSPFWIAFQDPVLRQEGLGSDRVGEAMKFFELPWYDIHYLFCACHYEAAAGQAAVAKRVRRVAREKTWSEWWLDLRMLLLVLLGRRP